MSLFPSNLVSLFFPAQCVGCEQSLDLMELQFGHSEPQKVFDHPAVVRQLASRGRPKVEFDFPDLIHRHWCTPCWERLAVGKQLQCPVCAASIKKVNPLIQGCPFCVNEGLQFDQAIAVGNYGGLLQELVVRMKNQRDEQLAIQLGSLLAYRLVGTSLLSSVDLVVPVPTHWRRRLQRGFSASEIVGETVARICGLERMNNAVQLIRKTEKQGMLSMAGRAKNVKNAFAIRPKVDVEGRSVLVIDDVMTSGATTSEVAKVLKAAGAKSTYVAVVARGTGVR